MAAVATVSERLLQPVLYVIDLIRIAQRTDCSSCVYHIGGAQLYPITQPSHIPLSHFIAALLSFFLATTTNSMI